MAKESTALVVPDKATLATTLEDAIFRRVDVSDAYDSEAVQQALAEQILRADDEDIVFGDASLPAWSDLIGVPVELHGVHFNPSQVDNGPGIYAVLDMTQLDTGERRTRHVGGFRPVSQLVWLWQRDRFPYKCMLTEVGKAKPGQNAPLGIKRLAAEPK